MKLFYIGICIENNEITSIILNCNGGYMDTSQIRHISHEDISYLVYGVVRVNNAKEALNLGFKYIEENKLLN